MESMHGISYSGGVPGFLMMIVLKKLCKLFGSMVLMIALFASPPPVDTFSIFRSQRLLKGTDPHPCPDAHASPAKSSVNPINRDSDSNSSDSLAFWHHCSLACSEGAP
ncbi:hypothetical protein B0H34DRAFT_282203 [Crassisporium funariophilum]|nr:hypothetical protein B0H34DRAFT_282203 [Crassisporium funariophilum]